MKRFLRYAGLAMLLALIPGCAQLPEYARPRMVAADDLQQTLTTGFAYRN